MVRTYEGSESGAARHRWARRDGAAGGEAPGYDRQVTDRGPLDAPIACPFLAFEDDRDGRSLRPDHRHRCFAEIRPAPRAIAHQERYCLTAAFATCPTFLDWARREAAVVREPAGGEAAAAVGGAGSTGTSPAGRDDGPPAEDAASASGPAARREWATPPPWSGEAELEGPPAPVPPFLASRGAPTGPAGPADADRTPISVEHPGGEDERDAVRPVIDPVRRAGEGRRPDIPPWERPPRYEAYPRLRTRMGLPSVPPLLLAAAAVVVAALALFFLPPMLLNLGGQAPASPSPSPTFASPSTAASPSPSPAPTPLVYTVKSGDTLSKIAKQFGVGLDALIEANKDRIPNPDRIDVGDQIIIPTPPPDVIPGGESSPGSSSEAPSPSP